MNQRKDEITGKLRHAGACRRRCTNASAEDLSFEDRTFDVAAAVSALDSVDDISRSVREISRVQRPGGAAIAVTPGDHPLTDWELWLATGKVPSAGESVSE